MTVDASVVMAVLLDEPRRPAVIARTAGVELLSAPTLPWEVGNAVSALVRRNRLGGVTARTIIEAFEGIPVRLIDVDLESSVALAARHEIYAYDAYVIECAKRMNIPLLSFDRRQMEVARLEGVETVEVE